MSHSISTLSLEQIADFHRSGFLAVGALATDDEVVRMRGLYDALFVARAGRDVGEHFDLAGTDEEGVPAALQQILNPSRYAPEFEQLACLRIALALAAQLLGPATEAQDNHAIMKSPGLGAATPWHQDEAYWNPELAFNALSVWISLEEATLENGCMHFIPGSHHREVLPHHSINHDPRIHGLEVDAPINSAGAVACPLPPGGATFHLARTLHYAGENKTDQPRRAYIMMFGTPPKPFDGVRRFPWLEQQQTALAERARKGAG